MEWFAFRRPSITRIITSYFQPKAFCESQRFHTTPRRIMRVRRRSIKSRRVVLVLLCLFAYAAYRIAESNDYFIEYRVADQPHLRKYLMLPPTYMLEMDFKMADAPLIDESSHLLFCQIPLVSKPWFEALFCRHNDIKSASRLNNPNDPKQLQFISNVCNRLVPRYDSSDPDHERVMDGSHWFSRQKWKKLAAVRNPFERFLSLWIEECGETNSKCFGCGHSILCYAKNNLKRIETISEVVSMNTPYSVESYMPQYWFCGFSTKIKHYEVIQEDNDFQEQITKNFEQAGFLQSLTRNGWGSDGKLPFLFKSAVDQRRHDLRLFWFREVFNTLQSAETVELILKAYLVDFIAFDFEIPKEAFGLCSYCLKPGCDSWLICSPNWIRRHRQEFHRRKRFRIIQYVDSDQLFN